MAAAQAHTAGMGPACGHAGLLAALRDDLGRRRISAGVGRLEQARPLLESLQACPGAGVLTGLVAQWVDAGFDRPSLVEDLLGRFPKEKRPELPLLDYLHLRMAHGFLLMRHEDYAGAAACFESVLAFSEEVEDVELFAIAAFWFGRCHRKQGRYDEALAPTERAERLAVSAGYKEMAAVIQVTLSWLAFQSGKLHEAKGLLTQALEALAATDDHHTRGNVLSAYGRIARREGKYEAAVERFEAAIVEFRCERGKPAALARSLVNLAFVKRLLAARAQKDVDRAAAARRSGGPAPADGGAGCRAAIERMREEARECLQEAAGIYEREQYHRGLAAVAITEGYLRLDAGDLEMAASDAAAAFTHASGRNDLITMARARTLQCVVAHTAVEEEVGDRERNREAAEAYARDAVMFAGRTENRRVLARAVIWRGLTLALDPADVDGAKACCEEAMSLLHADSGGKQYVWEDLEKLKTRVLRAQPVERVLRAWSAGIVEGRTFQQISEEFARIVIPRVWEREGRKVSRVAEKLSISPKKVRRILHAAGIKE
jgi:tetratricopeptide (TPR) repeat protein